MHKKLEIVFDTCPMKLQNSIRQTELQRLKDRGTFVIDEGNFKEVFPYHVEYSPNSSICWLIYACALGGASKIILFGFDGFVDNNTWLDSYYKKDLQLVRQKLVKGEIPKSVDFTNPKKQFEQYFIISARPFVNSFCGRVLRKFTSIIISSGK